jgi:hypothetical protein
LRRRLRSAERLSESAISRGESLENTPSSSVNASLVSVTRCDQRFGLRPPDVDLRFLAMAPILTSNSPSAWLLRKPCKQPPAG